MNDEVKIAAIEARKLYQKKWREKNRDRVRQYNENFWLRKAEELTRDNAREGGR